jgi:hypothetical protein
MLDNHCTKNSRLEEQNSLSLTQNVADPRRLPAQNKAIKEEFNARACSRTPAKRAQEKQQEKQSYIESRFS